jgi:hypothetical protein
VIPDHQCGSSGGIGALDGGFKRVNPAFVRTLGHQVGREIEEPRSVRLASGASFTSSS